MGSVVSSAVTSYHQLSSRSFRSSSSFNNPTSLPTNQQPLPLLSPFTQAGLVIRSATTPNEILCIDPPISMTESATAELLAPVEPARHVDTTENGSGAASIEILCVNPPTVMTESTNAAMEVQSVNPPTGIDPPQDESKRIADLAQPVSVAALALTLLINAPQWQSVKPNLLFLYNAYLVSLCLSLFTSIGLSMYSLVNRTQSQDFPWFQKRVMIIAVGSILISIMLRLFFVLPTTYMGYDGLCFVAVGAAIILYLWYTWRKANTSSRTAARSEISPQ